MAVLSRGGLCGLLGLLWVAVSPVWGAARTCEGIPVEVVTETPASLPGLCRAAGRALDFLAPYQLLPKRAIRIEVVERPLESTGHPVYGSYVVHSDRIQVMSYRAIREQLTAPQMYDQPFEVDHYPGVIAHEVAHALVQQNTPLAKISNAAQEYLAHATQLAVLPEARRAEVIRLAGVGPWEPDDVISDIYMAFAINRFAVKCYLHLTAHKQPLAFVNQLLTHKWRYVTVM